MKNILFIILLLSSSLVTAESFEKEIKHKTFEEAQKAQDIVWTVESTKVGLFSSDVDGYVLNYKYSGNLDKENLILRNMTLTFPISQMNSDSASRDNKLHNKCLGKDQYKNIVVKLTGPIFLKEKRQRVYDGTVLIRGKNKPFKIKIKPSISNNHLVLVAQTTWSLKQLEIPDPSIAVAKLSDDIRININISHKIN